MLLKKQLNISKHYKRIIFGVYIILFSSITFSQQNVTIGDNFKEIKLENFLSYSPVLNASESSIEKQTFINLPDGFDAKKVLHDTTWFKFTLINNSQGVKNLTFTIGNIHFETFSLFKETSSGLKPVFGITETKGVEDQNFFLGKNETATFYLKAFHHHAHFIFSPVITETNHYIHLQNNHTLISAAFYGGLIFIIAFSFILFFYFKQVYLASYALYVFSYGAFLSNYEGLFEHTLYVEHRIFSAIISISFIFLSYAFNILFLTDFLKTKRHFPKLYLFSRFLLFGLFMCAIIDFIPSVNDIFQDVVMIPSLVSMAFVFTLTIVSFRKKIASANMVLYSYLWLIFFGVLSLLVDFNILALPIHGNLLMKFGLFGELIMLTLAVVIYLFKVNDHLKERLRSELQNSREMNKDLEEKQSQLKHLSGIKDRFLVNISHEIRTPLNAILGTTTILKTQKLSEELNSHVEVIKSAGGNLMSIIDDILSFKILTKDEIAVSSSKFNISEELEKLCDNFNIEAQKKRIYFDFYNLIEDKSIRHIGDSPKIIKSISILIGNAIKYTNTGNIQVNLSISESTLEKDTLKVTVVDTGRGIEEKAKKNIFAVFAQEDDSYSRDFGGLGMGLAVFEKIISKLGGSIIFESKVNEGSTFGFTLSLDRMERQLTTTSHNTNNSELNILIVEDDEINRFIAKQLLQKVELNLNIFMAKDGKEGVEIVLNKDIDFVFMDLQMPVMNGYEATELIRSLEKGNKSTTPIVALTAHTQNSERIKSKEVGMNDFLTKPYTIEDLTRVIQTYTRKN